MTNPNSICEGVKATTRASELMAETAASLNGVPLTPERETAIREFMTKLNVGFIGDFDPTPNRVSYGCVLDCTQCSSRVGLSVKGELAEVNLPQECPDYDQMSVITQDDAVKQLEEQ